MFVPNYLYNFIFVPKLIVKLVLFKHGNGCHHKKAVFHARQPVYYDYTSVTLEKEIFRIISVESLSTLYFTYVVVRMLVFLIYLFHGPEVF